MRVRSITPGVPQFLDCVTVSGLQFAVSELDVTGWDEECDPEPPAAESVSVFAVTYKDGSELVFPAPQGIVYSEGARTVRVIGGPTVSLVEARFWQVEKR